MVESSNFNIFSVPEFAFISAKSVDPDKMLQLCGFPSGSNYPFVDF